MSHSSFCTALLRWHTAFYLRVGEGVVRYKERDGSKAFTYLLLCLYNCAFFCSKDASFIVEREKVFLLAILLFFRHVA